MIAEIITIGTEVVMGSTLNTNSLFLSQQLTELGIEVYFHTSVDDDENRLTSIIEIAINRSDIIITTGGLGPTNDDITKEIISKTLGLNMILDESMEKNIKDMFKNTNSIITNNNSKQAYKPDSSIFIENTIGTAPGIYIELNSKKIILLPGPPIEMELMFKRSVIGLIKGNLNIITKSLNLVGIGESYLESKINELKLNTENTLVLTFAKNGPLEIKIISKGNKRINLEFEIKHIEKILEKEFGEFIYGYDNIPLEEVVVNLLSKQNYKLGLCESITGGGISNKLTNVPGASRVFDRSLVTYSNNSKIKELGVQQKTLNNYGAVSKEIAYEMAKGLFLKSDIDIALSITGLAGPGGATIDKPIGLVYICIITKGLEKHIQCHFNGNRNLIRTRAIIRALDELRKIIK